MVIIEEILQFFSFIRIRRKYGKFNVKADKDLPFDMFQEKYKALAEHPDWIEWALSGQTLEGLSLQVEKLFFLCLQFPTIFKLPNKKLKNKKFTFESLTTIASMLLAKMYAIGSDLGLNYRASEIEIPEEDLGDLIIKSLENNNYLMFIYLIKKYTHMKSYQGSNVDFYVEAKVNLYLTKHKTFPWFIALLQSLNLKLNTIISLYVMKDNDKDLYTIFHYKQDIPETSLYVLLKSDRAQNLLEYKGEDDKTAFDIAVLSNHKYKDKLYEAIKDKKSAVNQALYHAAWQGNDKAVQYLLSKNQEVDLKLFTDHKGVKRNGLIKSCYQLISDYHFSEEANTHEDRNTNQHLSSLKIPTGDTLLHYCVRTNNAHYIRILCKNNANIFTTNKSGLSCLDLALQLGHQESFNVLMSFVDKTTAHKRDFCLCTIQWSQILMNIQSYLQSFSEDKTSETINFLIDYFAKPYHARHDSSNSFRLVQSLYFIRNKIIKVDHYNMNQPSFIQLPIIDRLATIADQYKNSNFAQQMQYEDPMMYQLMITKGFGSIIGMNEEYDHMRSWVEEKLKDREFCNTYKNVLSCVGYVYQEPQSSSALFTF